MKIVVFNLKTKIGICVIVATLVSTLIYLPLTSGSFASKISVLTDESKYSQGDRITITLKNTGFRKVYGVPWITILYRKNISSDWIQVYENSFKGAVSAYPTQEIATFVWNPPYTGSYRIIGKITDLKGHLLLSGEIIVLVN